MKKLSILHVLYQSEPNISGSSTRSKDIVQSQTRASLNPTVITSPFQQGLNTNYGEEIIEGIVYHRTYSGILNEAVSETGSNFRTRVRKLIRNLNFYSEISKVVSKHKPQIIHAHAMFFCAIPSILIGRKLKIPVIYEIRSLWEERKKDSKPKNKLVFAEYKILRALETFCMKNCDMVIAINANLLQEISERGISKQKVACIQNAVDLNFIQNQKAKLPTGTDHEHKFYTFGYIGSISPIEGLDMLIECFKNNLVLRNHKLQIYGGGKESEIEKLKNLAKSCSNIKFMGSIPRNHIFEAYHEIDVIVNPRVKSKITDSVTPLKPLEAMAFEKIIIASNVGGMKELIKHKQTGYLFEAGNLQDLEDKLIEIIGLNTLAKQKILKNALKYIHEERSWKSNAEHYAVIYQKLIDEFRTKAKN